jgi:hypothetical protein
VFRNLCVQELYYQEPFLQELYFQERYGRNVLPGTLWVVLGYRKLSLSIIDNFAIFLVIELSIISAKIIDNSR